jgi:hypothetical protein
MHRMVNETLTAMAKTGALKNGAVDALSLMRAMRAKCQTN